MLSASKTSTAPYENSGPTLLALQPAQQVNPPAPGKDWKEIFSQREARLGSLRTWRYTWWAYWASLAENILPRRYHWLVVANTMNRGVPINQAIVDSTATLAMQVCAAGMWSGLTSPSRPWFELGVGLPWIEVDSAAQEWLRDTQDKAYLVLAQSNFYTTMAQAFQDVSTFGTAPVIMYEDFEDVIRCYLPCAGEYYLAAGGRFSVDTLYREYTATVEQIVDFFKLENCPRQVAELWTAGGASLDMEFVVAHSIEPNFPLAKRSSGGEIRIAPAHFPFVETYWLKGIATERELSRAGFYERPFFAARWSTVSNDAYGRSPGMDALGDIKQLQQETRRKGEFIDKLIRPPMGADVQLKNEPSSIISGHITYTSTEGGKKGFWPLFEVSPAALPPMIEDLKEIQQRIDRCFFVDAFMAITNMEGVQPRNELELTKRDLERLQKLGPFVELFETEFADPAIHRLLAIMERRKLLKPKPPSLRNVPLKIEYTSILRLAQRAAETVSIESVMRVGGAMSEAATAAQLPNPLRILNLDKLYRDYAERSGNFPMDCFLTEREVREQDQMKQQQADAQAAAQHAMAAVQGAQVLSNTQIGAGQNALQAMIQGPSQGAPAGAP